MPLHATYGKIFYSSTNNDVVTEDIPAISSSFALRAGGSIQLSLPVIMTILYEIIEMMMYLFGF